MPRDKNAKVNPTGTSKEIENNVMRTENIIVRTKCIPLEMLHRQTAKAKIVNSTIKTEKIKNNGCSKKSLLGIIK